jgi:hypothetical protein
LFSFSSDLTACDRAISAFFFAYLRSAICCSADADLRLLLGDCRLSVLSRVMRPWDWVTLLPDRYFPVQMLIQEMLIWKNLVYLMLSACAWVSLR